MFKKPRDVSFKGSFNEAQRQADKKGQWLVISVYMHGEFPCDMQNRDLWSDENVKSFLRDNCIFMQVQRKEFTCEKLEFFLIAKKKKIARVWHGRRR